MSPVDFKKCPLSLFLKFSCRFNNKKSQISPVRLKERPCRPVEFKGQVPHHKPHKARRGGEMLAPDLCCGPGEAIDILGVEVIVCKKRSKTMSRRFVALPGGG